MIGLSFPRAAVLVLAFCCIAEAYGQVIWTGGGADDNWSTPENWAGGQAPVSGTALSVRFGADAKPRAIADGAEPWILNRLHFFPWPSASAPVGFDLSGNRLSFQGTTPTIEVGTMVNRTIANEIEIPQGQLGIRGPITFTGAITGAGGIDVSSDVTLAASSSYAGVTRVTAWSIGGLTVTHPEALGSTSSGTVVSWGSSLELRGGITIAGEALTLQANSKLVANGGSNTWTGDIALESREEINSRHAGDRLTISGAITGKGGSLTFRGDGDTSVSGSITNLMSYGITKAGSGTLTLSGTNGAIYGAYVEGGTLHVAKAAALPTNTYVQLHPLTNMGATLRITEDTAIGGIATLGSAGPATVDLASANLTITPSYNASFTGRIIGPGSLIKRGSGVLQIALTDTYSGEFVVEEGSLRIARDSDLGPPPAAPATALRLDGGRLEVGSYGVVATDANRTIRLGGRGGTLFSYVDDFTINGRITGTGLLRKSGDGVVVLSNPANDYSNYTIVDFGPLQFTTPSAIGGSGQSVVIAAAGALATSYPIEQALLARVSPWSKGVVALGAASSNDLDFAAAGLPEVWLGSVGHHTYGGIVTGYGGTVRLTALYGGLELTQRNALGNASLVEIGILHSSGSTLSGSVVLSNDNTIPGSVVINSRTAEVTQSTLACNDLLVKASATLQLTNATVVGRTVTVEKGGTLRGCGTIDAELINYGSVQVQCGNLHFTGPVTNHGHVGVFGSSTMTADGTFVNHGVLDLLTSPGAVLPTALEGSGRVIGFGQTNVGRVETSASMIHLHVEGVIGHRYQLQRSLSLTAGDWQNVGPARLAIGTANMGFDDLRITRPIPVFYRVVVDP